MSRAPSTFAGYSGAGQRAVAVSRPRLPFLMFILAIILLYVLEGGVLWFFGYNYQGLTGSAVTKIHPGTYLMVLVYLVLCLEHGDPIGMAVSMAARRPAALLLFIAAIVQMASLIARSGPGAAGVVDSFMLAPATVMIFSRTDRWTRDTLETCLHLMMIVNAGMGLVEFVIKHPYFPPRFDGEFSIYDMRPTALQGHPLGNALVTGVYILALISGGGTLSGWPRFGIILLELAALVAFGGRSALVVTVVLGGLYSLGGLAKVLRGGRIPLLAAATAVLGLTAVPLAMAGLVSGGFFDVMLQRFENDGGSAEARVKIADLFAAIPLRDLLVGPDPSLVEALRRVNALELGIENPIARMTLYQGAIVTGISILAFSLFLYELSRHSRRGMALPMIGFLLIINTFESLGGKSTMLTKFAIMMLVLYRPVAVHPMRAAQAGGSHARPGRPGARAYSRKVGRSAWHDET